MDQIKIGRFIAECRKEQGLTQFQLAEKLGITDRAVSKWERGISMPDSSVMLELCGMLGITVNDLLSGEIVTVDDYNKEMEAKLLEVIKQKEESDKRLLAMEWVIGSLSVFVLLMPIVIASVVTMEEWLRLVLTFSGFILAFVGFFFALKIEQVAGYYQCQKCGHTYVPTYRAMQKAMHMGRTRYMTCPACGEKSWQKKVIRKE